MRHPDATGPIAVRARNVTLSLNSGENRVEILKGIDLDIMQGESLAILGASGSGKSSLMAVLSGLEQATSGEITVRGIDHQGLGEDQLARARRDGIGIVLQSFHLFATMTALENVAVPLELAGHDDALERAAAELDAVGLAHRKSHYPTQLSGGEQQRVAIARAMATAPDIIFADEPTGNLDGATSGTIVDLLFARQRATGATLMIISHDPALAERCDRIVEMRDGLLTEKVT